MKTIKFWPNALKTEPSLAQLVVGNFKHQLQLAREIVHQLEVAQGGRQLSQLEIWLLHSLKKHSLALSSLLRTVARIRSRIDWLNSGYANMNLFHMH
jgi:site-specific recombinase XerC